ncbi:helix-turn-helix transcriptional regulator [Clostridium sp. YIM B02551]|uniref:helix-turn-helix transcriptional regulator n=1 Tax=Clostridium sp. YIM B02551 TaxID=2910679 RepID=UPI001EE9D262|nr:helix-turn-helix transcriptional regulator [Clostridium sp. YIM B02551]
MVLKTKEYRKKNGWSISQLSYKSKVARSYITELEEAKYDNPGVQIVCKFCKAFKVTPNDLIDEGLWKWW